MTDLEVSNEFAAFLEFLRDRGDIHTLDDAIAVVDKAWHWEAEYREFKDARAREEEMTA